MLIVLSILNIHAQPLLVVVMATPPNIQVRTPLQLLKKLIDTGGITFVNGDVSDKHNHVTDCTIIPILDESISYSTSIRSQDFLDSDAQSDNL